MKAESNFIPILFQNSHKSSKTILILSLWQLDNLKIKETYWPTQ